MSWRPDRRGKGIRKPTPSHPNHAKYAGVDRRIVACFVWMQDRVNAGRRRARVCAWEKTRDGLLAFYKEMGDIPEGMKRPSVGRIDHDLGYVPGNIQWEEHSFNSWRGRRPERVTHNSSCASPDNPVDDEIPF